MYRICIDVLCLDTMYLFVLFVCHSRFFVEFNWLSELYQLSHCNSTVGIIYVKTHICHLCQDALICD